MGDGRRDSAALVTVERLGLGLLLYLGFFDRHGTQANVVPVRPYFWTVTIES